MYKHENFNMQSETTGNRCIVRLSGELDLLSVQQLRASLDPLIKRTDCKLVLNLGQLQYIDSTGIGFIVSVWKARDRLNAEVAVEETPPNIERLFSIAGIAPILKS